MEKNKFQEMQDSKFSNLTKSYTATRNGLSSDLCYQTNESYLEILKEGYSAVLVMKRLVSSRRFQDKRKYFERFLSYMVYLFWCKRPIPSGVRHKRVPGDRGKFDINAKNKSLTTYRAKDSWEKQDFIPCRSIVLKSYARLKCSGLSTKSGQSATDLYEKQNNPFGKENGDETFNSSSKGSVCKWGKENLWCCAESMVKDNMCRIEFESWKLEQAFNKANESKCVQKLQKTEVRGWLDDDSDIDDYLKEISNIRNENPDCCRCSGIIYEGKFLDQRRYGILEKCNHAFCYACVKILYSMQRVSTVRRPVMGPFRCPKCGVVSKSVAASSRWIGYGSYKEIFFEEFYANTDVLNSMHMQHIPVSAAVVNRSWKYSIQPLANVNYQQTISKRFYTVYEEYGFHAKLVMQQW